MHDKIIKEIKAILKKDLISIAEFQAGEEKKNVLFVLDGIDFETLNQIKPLILKKRKEKMPVPLFFTKEELLQGADVFPLEFLNIKNPHKNIYGEDILAKIKFDKKHVRRQIEFELRSKLIHFRENFIWIKNDKELKELILSAIPSLMPLFYGLLFLKDVEPKTNLNQMFSDAQEKYKITFDILKEINDLRNGNLKADKKALLAIADELIIMLEKLIRIIDKI